MSDNRTKSVVTLVRRELLEFRTSLCWTPLVILLAITAAMLVAVSLADQADFQDVRQRYDGAVSMQMLRIGHHTASYYEAYGPMLDGLLAGGGEPLSKAEQVGVAQDLRAMVAAGDILEGEALARVAPLMALDNRHVVDSAVADEYKRGTMITPLYDTLQEKGPDSREQSCPGRECVPRYAGTPVAHLSSCWRAPRTRRCACPRGSSRPRAAPRPRRCSTRRRSAPTRARWHVIHR